MFAKLITRTIARQRLRDGSDLEGDGRADLYAGFCDRRSCDRRRRPSI
jgi:hypothetical protein